ncbi:hypothetical protein Ccrd_024157 [Cynara cardunculus var. scolymus]|uniref:Uncharacterized protein n=1 Tax=Cynara cardunculus var. scolymus TaxID=59895 RepID=A0A124SAR7_CYNCS|nr:hypothetical protein Ccrd_024157 [Cynara cardunculus var. scolymus]
MFQRLYGGCISTDEMVVRRRPYHSNCNCALHKFSGGGHCSSLGKVSYPIRRSWSEGSMVAMKSTALCSPSSSTVETPLTAAKDSPAATLPTCLDTIHILGGGGLVALGDWDKENEGYNLNPKQNK